jgi:hypothetical protein
MSFTTPYIAAYRAFSAADSKNQFVAKLFPLLQIINSFFRYCRPNNNIDRSIHKKRPGITWTPGLFSINHTEFTKSAF